VCRLEATDAAVACGLFGRGSLSRSGSAATGFRTTARFRRGQVVFLSRNGRSSTSAGCRFRSGGSTRSRRWRSVLLGGDLFGYFRLLDGSRGSQTAGGGSSGLLLFLGLVITTRGVADDPSEFVFADPALDREDGSILLPILLFLRGELLRRKFDHRELALVFA
jgi:hypothetical protein